MLDTDKKHTPTALNRKMHARFVRCLVCFFFGISSVCINSHHHAFSFEMQSNVLSNSGFLICINIGRVFVVGLGFGYWFGRMCILRIMPFHFISIKCWVNFSFLFYFLRPTWDISGDSSGVFWRGSRGIVSLHCAWRGSTGCKYKLLNNKQK